MFDGELFLDSDEVKEETQEVVLDPSAAVESVLTKFFESKNDLALDLRLYPEQIITDGNIATLVYLPFGTAMNVFYMSVEENKDNQNVASLRKAFESLGGDPEEEDIDGYKLFFRFQEHCHSQFVPQAYIGSLLIVFLRICMRYDL